MIRQDEIARKVSALFNNPSRFGSGISNPAVSFSNPNITITATTRNLTSGRFGARISIGEGSTSYTWYDGAGAASSQSLTLSLTDIGAVAGDVINIDPGYSLTDPAGTKVYASDSGLYPTATVVAPTITGTATDGQTLTGVDGTIVGPIGQVITENWLQCDSGGNNCANEGGTAQTLLLDSGNVGSTIKFQKISTKGSSVVTGTSAATSAVASGASAIGLEGGADEIIMESGDMVLMESGPETDISGFISATTLDGTEDLLGVQGGNSRRITPSQIKTYVNA